MLLLQLTLHIDWGSVLNWRQDSHVTTLLNAWAKGGVFSYKLDNVVDELSHQAAEILKNNPNAGLNVGDLIGTAFERLLSKESFQVSDRGHFFALMTTIMRSALIDIIRAHHRQKRGGGEANITLITHAGDSETFDYESLYEALNTLGELSPLALRIVELRYFGGFTIPETCAQLDITANKHNQLWMFAKVHLVGALDETKPR